MTRQTLGEGGFGERPNAAVFQTVSTSGSTQSAVSVPHNLEMLRATLSLSDQSYHGPNERFEWFQARGGILTYAEYFRRLAEPSP